jgi:hypothetical protein
MGIFRKKDKTLAFSFAALFSLAASVPATAQGNDGPISLSELDQALARRVREFLGPSMASRLEISVQNGQVTLRGVVETPKQRVWLEERAQEITGQKLNDQTSVAVKN